MYDNLDPRTRAAMNIGGIILAALSGMGVVYLAVEAFGVGAVMIGFVFAMFLGVVYNFYQFEVERLKTLDRLNSHNHSGENK
jgi:hypothetical protein